MLEEKDKKLRILQDGIVPVSGPLSDFKRIEIDLFAIGILVKKGERLGLEISWSNFPKYALPPQSGQSIQSVLSGPDRPSHATVSVLK